MASITLTVDDSIVPRLRAAYGVDTNGELKQAIIDEIRQTVIGYERSEAIASANSLVTDALAAQDAEVEAAVASALTDIVLS